MLIKNSISLASSLVSFGSFTEMRQIGRTLPILKSSMKNSVRFARFVGALIFCGILSNGFLYGADLVTIKDISLIGGYKKVPLTIDEAARLFPGKAVSQQKSFNGGGAFKIVQNKTLKFNIQNSATKTAETFIARFLIVGRDIKTSKATVLERGEASVTLNPREQTEISSKEISAVHYLQSGKNFGMKIVGQAIEVYHGSQIVAESYSEIDFKKLFASVAE